MKWSKEIEIYRKSSSKSDNEMILDYKKYKNTIVNANPFSLDIFNEILEDINIKQTKNLIVPRKISKINSVTIIKIAKVIRRFHVTINEQIIREFVNKTKHFSITNTKLAKPKDFDDLDENETQCSICFEFMYRPVQYIPCGHVVCLPCFYKNDISKISHTIINNKIYNKHESPSKCIICNSSSIKCICAKMIDRQLQVMNGYQKKVQQYEKNKDFLILKKFLSTRLI